MCSFSVVAAARNRRFPWLYFWCWLAVYVSRGGWEANGPPLHGFVVDGYFSPSQVGDRIVTICGTSTEGMTHTQAVNLLKNASGSIEMQVRFLSQLFRLWVAWGHMSFDVKTIKWNFLLVFYLLFPLNRNDYIESSKKVHRKYILSHFFLNVCIIS